MKTYLKILLLVSCFFQNTIQDAADEENEIETDFEDVLESFFESDSGKHMSDALFNLGASKNANQILEGIGTILGGDSESAPDSSALKNVFYALTANPGMFLGDGKENVISWLIELFGKEGGLENLMNFMPTVFSAFNAFIQSETQKGEAEKFLPSIFEKLEDLFNYLKHSQVGMSVFSFVEETQFFKSFSTKGSFDFVKFGESLENHSFRKYWIEQMASLITPVIQKLFDPSFRNAIIVTLEGQFNSALKAKGYPKHALFNAKEPVDSTSAFLNHMINTAFGYKIRSKQYVKPVYEYIKNMYNSVMYKGYFAGKKVKDDDLSRQVTDVINLELIEPIVRVYRAYRFAKANKKCDKYVMCLVNQDVPDETVKLPTIKRFLYWSSSLAASWSLSGYTGTSFWTLYSNIMDNKDCKKLFHASCEDFHAEEVRVKKEYVHSEL